MPAVSPHPVGSLGLVLDSQDETLRSIESNRFGIAGWSSSGNVTVTGSGWAEPAGWSTTVTTGTTGNILATMYAAVTFPGGPPTSGYSYFSVGLNVDGSSLVVAILNLVDAGALPYTIYAGGYAAVSGLATGVPHTCQFAVYTDGIIPYNFATPAMAIWPF